MASRGKGQVGHPFVLGIMPETGGRLPRTGFTGDDRPSSDHAATYRRYVGPNCRRHPRWRINLMCWLDIPALADVAMTLCLRLWRGMAVTLTKNRRSNLDHLPRRITA